MVPMEAPANAGLPVGFCCAGCCAFAFSVRLSMFVRFAQRSSCFFGPACDCCIGEGAADPTLDTGASSRSFMGTAMVRVESGADGFLSANHSFCVMLVGVVDWLFSVEKKSYEFAACCCCCEAGAIIITGCCC